jgi:hypothetical protein
VPHADAADAAIADAAHGGIANDRPVLAEGRHGRVRWILAKLSSLSGGAGDFGDADRFFRTLACHPARLGRQFFYIALVAVA